MDDLNQVINKVTYKGMFGFLVGISQLKFA